MIRFEEEARYAGATDEELVERVIQGEIRLYELLIRRNNQRVYRVARSIVRNDHEAEDIAQDAYVRAWENLHRFRGEASFATWLTRIAVYEALARTRKQKLLSSLQALTEAMGGELLALARRARTPEHDLEQQERNSMLARAIEALPVLYRTVFVLRDIEELSVGETARMLGISEVNVRVRHNRARVLLRRTLRPVIAPLTAKPFPLHLRRCDSITEGVLQRIGTAALSRESVTS